MLSESQVAKIEQRLLEERRTAVRMLRTTRRDIGHDTEWDGDLTRTPTHLAEQGSEAQKELFDIQTAERHSELLTLIDRALRRLRESPADYDVSVISGERIPFERLELVPWTRVLANEIAQPMVAVRANGNGNGNGNSRRWRR